jgi:hypothetical protein
LSTEIPGPGPEARAALRKRLREVLQRIPDRDVRQEYERDLQGWLAPGAAVRKPVRRTADRPGLGRALLQVEAETALEVLRPLVEEPSLLGPFGDAVATLVLPERWSGLRDALLTYAAADEPLETEAVLAHLRCSDFDRGMLVALSQPSRLFAQASDLGGREEAYGRLIEMHALRQALRVEREARAQAAASGDSAALATSSLAIADLEERLTRVGRALDGHAA